MANNKIYEDLSQVMRRSQKILSLVEIFFLFLVFFYWKIQILDHNKYWRLAEANRIREMLVPSPRGLIQDRNDVILANNTAAFNTSFIRENSKNRAQSLNAISELLKIDKDTLEKRIKKYESLPVFKPIVIKENLNIEEVSRIEGRRLELPELVIETEPRRYYPFASLAAHVIGYLQELSQDELKSDFYKDRHLGDLCGKNGIEKEYESQLVGTDGKVFEIVDSLGKPRGEIRRIEPQQGQDIKLSLDFDLQKLAEELLQGREGAIVVMDAKTGEILALASYPTYDPNKFINRFTPEEWLGLVRSPFFPLENRAIRGLYSPGSIFKLTMALGALESNVITEQTSFFCSGTTQIYGRPFACWFKPGHGSLELYNAIRYSCNIYFYNLGRRMGIEEIARFAEILGYGKKTGVDLPGEKEGLVPHPEWKKKTRNAAWFPGETISVSIGQGPLLVTPLQVAAHTALIATRGLKVWPHLLKSPLKKASKQEAILDEMPAIKIKRSSFEKIIEGMWRSANEEGTGRAAKVEGFDVCGKTGSTQLISSARAEVLAKQSKEIKSHSWFTGFAPRNDPKVVVTVLVEFGGMGGATAAPLAKYLFELYKKKYD